MKCNQSRPGFELVSPCPFPTTITITPRAPPYISSLLLRKGRNGFTCGTETATERRRTQTALIDTTLCTYSELYFCFSAGGHSPPRVAPKTACFVYSLAALGIWLNIFACRLRISCHYTIFLTAAHFPSGSQFSWFIHAVPLFTPMHILFRNPPLTCCQRSICNTPPCPIFQNVHPWIFFRVFPHFSLHSHLTIIQ